MSESHVFQAETQQLLEIVIHSLYSNKEIFLRELISNASDAIDRRRFEALTTPELMEDDVRLEIRVDADAEARTLTIQDNGIGMNRDELIANIGTIAKSGTRELLKELEQAGKSSEAADLIGQFGVGFYSAFMVSDEVTLVTRRAGEEKATQWQSKGDGQYELDETTRFFPGTTITLKLKPVDADNGLPDFTESHRIKELVRRYSDFVAYPITMKEERQQPVLDGDGNEVEGETKTVVEEITVNSMRPIWTRDAAEVPDDEFKEFYRHITHDWTEPLDWMSLRAEGRIEYSALLYLPSQAPMDLFYRDQKYGLQLYVRRVLIDDRFENLLPFYLRFVRGVVDANDLPLNVSRELVQQDRHVTAMRSWLTRKVLDHLKKMVKDDDRSQYESLWEQFGRVIKEGVTSDHDNRKRLLPLLLFRSSLDSEKWTTLADYVERMPEEQEEIYYLSGESLAVVQSSPHLERLRSRGYEVLYLVDPVDEFMVDALGEVEGKKLRSAGKGDIELGTEEERQAEKEKLEEQSKELGDLLGRVQSGLDEWVSEVRLSQRLTDSPACLVAEEHGMSPHLERLLRQQAETADHLPTQKRVLELNPSHPLCERLQSRFGESTADDEGASADLADFSYLLLGYALLAEGSDLPDATRFNKLLEKLLVAAG